ncbi:hypothetical protein COCNU_04G013090 [Cocos nucifera]|uniref:Uncharacterized protein n=1 Tax=Cocos nucifera TaxID=13894 RepID=A0A8K0N0R6_COCNU|nr:hypothetical protein COCNU_04G013090 [Cocos nucifera]
MSINYTLEIASYMDGELTCKTDTSVLSSEEKNYLVCQEFAKNYDDHSSSLQHMAHQPLVIKDDTPEKSNSEQYVEKILNRCDRHY